jgi:branched-subunit amino acid ABC-type transport system permease component
MKRLIEWHKDLLDDLANRLGLSVYQLVWIAFLKGAVVGAVAGVLL